MCFRKRFLKQLQIEPHCSTLPLHLMSTAQLGKNPWCTHKHCILLGCTGLADYNTAQLVIFHHILQVTQAVTPAFSESLALFGLILPRDRVSLRAGEDLTFSDSRYSKHFLKKNFPFSTHILADPSSLPNKKNYYNCASTLNYCALMLQSLNLSWWRPTLLYTYLIFLSSS